MLVFLHFFISAHFTPDRLTNHTFALPQSSLKSQREQNTHLDDRMKPSPGKSWRRRRKEAPDIALIHEEGCIVCLLIHPHLQALWWGVFYYWSYLKLSTDKDSTEPNLVDSVHSAIAPTIKLEGFEIGPVKIAHWRRKILITFSFFRESTRCVSKLMLILSLLYL